jgi:hypothetical protein
MVPDFRALADAGENGRGRRQQLADVVDEQ